MKHLAFASAFLTFAALVQPASAAITRYTDRAAFEAALQPGFYLEPNMNGAYPNYSGNGFSYVASATGGDSGIGNDLSTQSRNPSEITFDFGPQINAFGGYLYITDFGGRLTTGNFKIDINSGASIYNEVSTSKTSFYGFISDANFANAKISVASANYATVGSLIVGTTTPVPGPLPLLGAASAFSFSRRLRRRVSRARRVG